MAAPGGIPSEHKTHSPVPTSRIHPRGGTAGNRERFSLPKPRERSGNNRGKGIVASLQAVGDTELPVKRDLLRYLGFMTNFPWNEFIPRRSWWWPDLFPKKPPWILDFHIPGMRNGPKSMDRYHLKHKKNSTFSDDIPMWLQIPRNSQLEKIREKKGIRIPRMRFIWNWWLCPKEIQKNAQDLGRSHFGRRTKTLPCPGMLPEKKSQIFCECSSISIKFCPKIVQTLEFTIPTFPLFLGLPMSSFPLFLVL